MTPTTGAAREVESAAAVLVAARRVLVTGFAAAGAETATLACDLAEALGAAVDPGGEEEARVAGPTLARIGGVTADAEELRDRADLVVFWFCPAEQAAKFREAFVTPATAAGRPRTVLDIGPVAAGGGRGAVQRTGAVDLARLLHAAVAGIVCPAPPAALAAARDAVGAALDAAGCVAFVTCHDDPLGLEPWSLVGLVRAIAHNKPAFEVPVVTGGGAAAVCTWRYGAAGAIARADRDGGIFLPAECDALRLVARGEVDCVVAVGPLPAPVAAAARERSLTVVQPDPGALAALVDAVRSRARAGGRP